MKRIAKTLYDLRDKDWWKRPRLRLAKVESHLRPNQKETWAFLILPDRTEVCLGIFPSTVDRENLLVTARERLRDLWDPVHNRRWPDDC